MIGLTEGLITNALYDVAKKILKKDPIRSALDQTIDELTQEKQIGWYELREIDRSQKEIFNNINIIEEVTFLKILIDNGVLPETASKLYKKFSEKFNENIKEAALKEPAVFYPYAIREFAKINTDNKELIKLLTGFADKEKFYLDRIIKHFKKLEKIPINIPDIQSVLRKDETKEGEFFKKEPEWVDYEQGYIVERKEVNEIVNKLDSNKVQLILGKPASGKSIILKHFGYKLANQNKKVHIVELKKHQIEDVKLYFETIPEINDENTIFIVDDAHLYPLDCERLIRDFKSGGKGRLIIGSRPTEDILPNHPKKTSEFQFLNKTEIQAEDVTEEIIRTFLKKQHNFGDERIETVSCNLEKHKNDLWQLSWALNSYNHEKDSVVDEDIYENLMESIREIETKEKNLINAEDVFLPLSVFYRFEIQIERDFLEEQLEIKERDILNQLIKISEIIETREKGNRMLSLNHSSIAELYFDAYNKYSFFGKRIKKKILNGKNEEDLEFCLFHRYMTTADPRNAVDVVMSLDYFDEKGGTTLINNLIKVDKIQEIIKKGINKENDIEKIGYLVSVEASEDVALILVNSIDIKSLSSKINNEEDITKVGSCVSGIAEANSEVSLKLLEHIDIKLLSSKINKEEDIRKVESCVSEIARVSTKWAQELVDSVSTRIDKEDSIEMIGLCIFNISYANTKVALKLLDRNINILVSKIDKAEIREVGWCIYYIAKASKEFAMKLVDSISIRIEKENDKENIKGCLSDISEASEEITNEILKRLNPIIRDEVHK